MSISAADFKALIPDPSASMCGNFINSLLKLPVLLYQWIQQVEGTSSGGGGGGGGTVAGTLKPGDLIFSAAPAAADSTRLLCDGTEYPQATYPALFAAIGNIYGTPSNSANFKVPNFSGRFPVGVGNFPNAGAVSLGNTGGSDQQAISEANLPLYTPGPLKSSNGTDKVWTDVYGTGPTKNGPGFNATQGAQNQPEVDFSDPSYGSSTPTQLPILPPYVGTYIYIKT